nr:type IV toxin-antitoxin system AbiEi family antitoxin [uncultured Desulfuromonas sp.]
MSQPTSREKKLIQAIIDILHKRPGLDAEFVADDSPPPFSGSLRLFGDWGSITRPVRLAWRITPQQGQLLAFQLETLKDHQPILLADYIPESLSSQLQRHHIDFLDTIGNGAICAPPLFYEVSGRRKKTPKLPPNRSQQSTGAKILFQLLRDPQLCRQSYRIIAERASVALGAVGPVINELKAKNLLIDTVDKKTVISDLTALRQLWETAYTSRLRPKLEVDRCTLSSPWKLDSLPLLIREQHLEDHVLIGGELAASFYCENVHPRRATLHLPQRTALKQMLQLRLTPCENGPITVIRQFADNLAFEHRSPEGLQLADPRLVRCELLLNEDHDMARIAEAIERLYLLDTEQQGDQYSPQP